MPEKNTVCQREQTKADMAVGLIIPDKRGERDGVFQPGFYFVYTTSLSTGDSATFYPQKLLQRL